MVFLGIRLDSEDGHESYVGANITFTPRKNF